MDMVSGSPQFRITSVMDADAPLYHFYGQTEIENDLVDMEITIEDAKTIRTNDNVNIVADGDIIFSLISGKATLVRGSHEGYLYTQNYVKLIPGKHIDKKYVIYLLNESDNIKKQWSSGLQGTMVLKYTIKQLKELELSKLPSFNKQEIIGNIYFYQLKLQALKERVVKNEKLILFEQLKRFNN